ncbi:MAG: TRAP transporter small permease [Thermodesulfobacteriota bacterium]
MWNPKQLSRWLDGIAAGMHALAAILMFFLIFITTSDVVGRVILNIPLPGIPEVIKVSLVLICFLLLPEATRGTHHIRSAILVDRLRPFWARLLAVVRFSLGTLLLIGIAVATWDKMIKAWKIWEYEGEGVIRVPVAPVRTVILISCVLAAVFSFRLLRQVIKGNHGKP